MLRTEIKGLDESVEGGFPDGSIILLLGNPGTGVETFAQQILYLRALKAGKVAYFTIERSPRDIKEDMAIFGWNLKSVEEAKTWDFVDAYTSRLVGYYKKMGETGQEADVGMSVSEPGALSTLRDELTRRLNEKRWTAIDTLSHLLMMHELKDVVDALGVFTMGVRDNGGLHFLIMIKGMHDPKTITTMSHLADGVIEFQTKERAGVIVGAMGITKMRRNLGSLKLIPYAVTDRGITVETAVRIA
jgi:KaiC/GvpD/RAD55 family RecA-like ATPase